MKCSLAVFMAILFIVVQFTFTFSLNYRKMRINPNPKSIKKSNPNNKPLAKERKEDPEDPSDFEKESFYPVERIKKYGPNMGKYFTRFAKLAYCNLNHFTVNPVCEKIKEEWDVDLSTQYVKVLVSTNKSPQKKIVYSCSSPRELFDLNEEKLVYKNDTNHFVSTHFGAYDYFANFYEEKITDESEKLLLQSILKNMNSAAPIQIFFVGHSYGGVLCNILALKASEMKEFNKFKDADSPVLITYGSPNIGGKVFADNTESRIPLVFRIIATEDALPTYPRTVEEDKIIKKNKYPKMPIQNIGKHIVVIFWSDKHYMCPRTDTKKPKACNVRTDYISANNMFYFDDNLAGISPNSEFNKAWDMAASIGAKAYAAFK